MIEKLRHQLAGHRAHRFGASSETAEQLQLALETSEIAAAAMTARMKLPDIEERGKPKRRPIPDHIRRIELTKAEIWLERLRRRLELGRHHLAWPAPLSPEIDQQWQFGIRMTVKISRCKRDGPALKEGRAAASAIGIIGQALLRHSVSGIAVRASDRGHPVSFR